MGQFDVTIGLVTLNEERTIGKSLGALMEELKSVGGELYVVAGGRDRTLEIAKEIVRDNADAHVLEDTEPRGKPAALNRMFELAKGRVLILSDGDVVVQKGSVRRLLDVFSSDDVGAASGRVIGSGPKSDYGAVERACDLMTEMIHRSRSKMFAEKGTIALASGYLLAVRRDLVGKIPEDANSDDGYTSLLVRSKEKRIAYVPEAVVEINYPKTFSDFLNQKTRTRIGHMQLGRIFPDLESRTMSKEMDEFLGFTEARKSLGYGPPVSFLAVVLTGVTWVTAYARFHAKWLSKERIWRPVPSTK